MIKQSLILSSVFMLTMACSSGQNRSNAVEADGSTGDLLYGDEQEEGIAGTWINSTIDVDLNTYNNSDTSFHVSITEDNWELKMNIKPVETIINEDGTFLNNYLDTLGNLFHTNSGIWYIDGDSLFLEDKEGELFTFHVTVNGNLMEMHTVIDYDEDGQKDDNYFGRYKRVKKNNN